MNTAAALNGIIILGCLLANVQEGFSSSSHFFYTASTFPEGAAIIDHGYHQYSTPNIFFSRSYFPAPPFYFNNQKNTFQRVTAKPELVQAIDLRQTQPSAKVKTTFVPGSSDYRGFAYHTTYDDGGSSNVVFVTGAESVQLLNLLYPTQKTRTLASDITDENAVSDGKEEIQNSLNQSSFPTSFQIIHSFFENPSRGVQNFYERNSQLFTANAAPENLRYPAGTAPLYKPIPLDTFNVSPPLPTVLTSNNTLNSTEPETASATAAVANAEEEEEEVAESIIIENSRTVLNQVPFKNKHKTDDRNETTTSASSDATTTDNTETTEMETTTTAADVSTTIGG